MYEIARNVFLVIKNVGEEDNTRRGRCARGTYCYKPAEEKFITIAVYYKKKQQKLIPGSFFTNNLSYNKKKAVYYVYQTPTERQFLVYLFLSQL